MKQVKITSKTKTKKEISNDLEKMQIIAKSDEKKGFQLTIGEEGKLKTVKEIKDFAFAGAENPDKKYDIYYKGIMKLMKANLPKGKENLKARKFVYEEKNVFLTRGKRINEYGKRGADGRMGYIKDSEEAMKVVINWVRNNGTAVDLFNTFRDLNIKKGYGISKS